ncbi:hypothetical protein [Pseudomonas sp. DSP3-2-2]|uniref:hypothetical protein n=1 Tax=unclassified Pseudomonas TaxID=196821 RepID=UPI003CF19122
MPAAPRSFRQYAQLVISEPFADGQKALMDKCPPDWVEMVKLIVDAHERRVAEYVQQKEKLRPKSRLPSPDLGTYQAPAAVRGNPVVAARSLAGIRAAITKTQEYR